MVRSGLLTTTLMVALCAGCSDRSPTDAQDIGTAVDSAGADQHAVDGPGKAADGPGNTADGPSKAADGPGKDGPAFDLNNEPDLGAPDQAVPDLTIIDQAVPDAPLPTCTDGVKNGDETDADCGGKTCGACAVGKKCGLDADCQSQVCKAGVCAAPSCTDGVKNGDETDTDCGGKTCGACGTGFSE